MFSDYLNVQSMLWLTNSASYNKDISLLNIDSFRMQQYFGDEPNEYFNHYKKSFRRILKAKDFGSSKVCFKNLIMQPKPEIQFTRDGWRNDLRCSFIGPSSIFQRWNLNMRDNFGLLNINSLETNNIFTILLVTRAYKLGSKREKTKKVKLTGQPTILDISGSHDKLPSAQGISNSKELVQMLNELTSELIISYPHLLFKIVEQELDILSFDKQIELVAKSSIIIGMHGTGIALSMHMAIGSTYCCGVIEIFPSEGDDRDRESNDRKITNTTQTIVYNENKKVSRYRNLKGHGNMARRMGHKYQRVDLMRSEKDKKSVGKIVGDSNIAAQRILGASDSRQGGVKMAVDSTELGPFATADSSALDSKTERQLTVTSTVATTSNSNSTSVDGTYVSPLALRQSVTDMVHSILKTPSCLLPNVVKKTL